MKFPTWKNLPTRRETKKHVTPRTNVAFIVTWLVALAGFVLLSGCGSVGNVIEQGRETARDVQDLTRSASRTVRYIGQGARNAGRAARNVKQAGQDIRSIRKKELNLELQKSSKLQGVNVRVRPSGADQFRPIAAGEFARYAVKVSRWVNAADMIIYTEIEGQGVPLKVRKEFLNEVQQSNTTLLTLVHRNGEFKWIPPSETGNDQEIIFN